MDTKTVYSKLSGYRSETYEQRFTLGIIDQIKQFIVSCVD